MRYEQGEFVSDRSVIKSTILEDQITFSAAPRLPLEAFFPDTSNIALSTHELKALQFWLRSLNQ